MKKLFLIIVMVLLFHISCQKQIFTPAAQNELGQLSFSMSMANAPVDVVSINGFLSKDSHDTIFFNFSILNDSAFAFVENINPGVWSLTVNAFNADNVIIYNGSTDVNVSPGIVTQVYLQLNPVTGSLEIIVTWGAPTPQDSAMIMYFPFNGNANDESGYGNDGMVFGAQLTNDRNGNPNSAYLFDGYNDYIDIGVNDVLKPQLPISISMWINVDNVNGNSFTTNFNATNYHGVFLGVAPSINEINLSYCDGGPIGPSSRRTKHISFNTPNVWFHLVGNIRGETDIDIYINGINASGTYSGSGGAIAYDDGHMNFGRIDSDHNGPARYYSGKLDEIIMFNRSLSEQEVLLLYQGEL